MNLRTLASALSMLDGHLYIHCPPIDFTDSKPPILVIYDGTRKVEIPLEKDELEGVVKSLSISVFAPGRIILCWDIKGLYSFLLYHTKEPALFGEVHEEPESKYLKLSKSDKKIKRPLLLDLKILESYSGVDLPPPKSYSEAAKRLGNLKPIGFSDIYNKIHVPLFREVMPQIETVGMLEDRTMLHAHYEIEGQVNGRVKCTQQFARSYNPHNMSTEKKGGYKSPFMDSLFLIIDYQALEARVVQWLSQDEQLGEMLAQGDVYFNIYKSIVEQDANFSDGRKFGKMLFLSVIFGSGPSGVASSLKIPLEFAEKLIDRIQKTFPNVFSYLKTQQNLVESNGIAIDCCGRKRRIESDKSYLVRNFCVQSPAATLCLAKLIDLYNYLKFDKSAELAFYIHDAYGIFVKEQSCKRIIQEVKKVLELENGLFPGLKLKVSCKVGYNLNKMMNVKNL